MKPRTKTESRWQMSYKEWKFCCPNNRWASRYFKRCMTKTRRKFNNRSEVR